ncbi:AI-2E family transporter [Halalkalibacillus halophilus]|uniref:AI-2E family transporter n=1 Tax=Halalkalibacillus halophilus TaxID=392827 RepID=UPI000403EE65|nr:AI-2E family transporter [Halalkalibacillus halophilus]
MELIKKLFIILIVGILVIVFVHLTFPLLLPIYISLLLAILIAPGVRTLEKNLPISRGVATLLILLTFVASIIGLVLLSMHEAIQFIQYFGSNSKEVFHTFFTNIHEKLFSFIEAAQASLEKILTLIGIENKTISKDLTQDFLVEIQENSHTWVIDILQRLSIILLDVLQSSYIILFILIGTYFISKDGPSWINTLKKHVPPIFIAQIESIEKEGKRLTKSYILAQIILLFLTGIVVYIGLSLFSFEYALALAFLAMLLDMIPLIGVAAIFIPWSLYALLTNDLITGIQLLTIYTVILIIRHLVEPKILGATLGTHPFLILCILYIMLNLYGLSGVLLSPMIILLLITLRNARVLEALYSYIIK